MIIIPIVTIIVCHNGSCSQTWTVASKTWKQPLNICAYIHEIHTFTFASLNDNVLILQNKRNKQLKMAAVTIMRTYLWVVINVSAETPRTIIDQGLDDFDSLVEITESDMKTLFTTSCCPGGMIINPSANTTDQNPTICDPGHLISMVSEKRLIMTAYAAIHR